MPKVWKAICLVLASAIFMGAAQVDDSKTPPGGNKVADHYLLCLIHLRDTDSGLINARDSDPKEDAAEAVAARDYRPAGYRQPGSVEAIGTDCPKKFTAFTAVLGFDTAPHDACMALYAAEAKPYVMNY